MTIKQVFLIVFNTINFINQEIGVVEYVRDKIDLLREKAGTRKKEELISTKLKSKAFIDRGYKKNNNGKPKSKGD